MNNEQNLGGSNMTKQEIFDIVWKGILSQGGPSLNHLYGCAYRGENNRKCAAGLLISDEDYTKDYEGEVVSTTVPNKLTEYFESKNLNIAFIAKLQSVHDNAWCDSETDEDFLKNWKSRMRNLALCEELKTPV